MRLSAGAKPRLPTEWIWCPLSRSGAAPLIPIGGAACRSRRSGDLHMSPRQECSCNASVKIHHAHTPEHLWLVRPRRVEGHCLAITELKSLRSWNIFAAAVRGARRVRAIGLHHCCCPNLSERASTLIRVEQMPLTSFCSWLVQRVSRGSSRFRALSLRSCDPATVSMPHPVRLHGSDLEPSTGASSSRCRHPRPRMAM